MKTHKRFGQVRNKLLGEPKVMRPCLKVFNFCSVQVQMTLFDLLFEICCPVIIRKLSSAIGLCHP